jgi:hypothetical protein
MKIILIILAILIGVHTKAFSLVYEKKVATTYLGLEKGRTETEGFFLNGVGELPVCQKLNTSYYSIMRQGMRINYDSKNKIHSKEKGLFDCVYAFSGNEIRGGLYEGIQEFFNTGELYILFKQDQKKKYAYSKSNNSWYFNEHDIEFMLGDPRGNLKLRLATPAEIEHAEKLYQFYEYLDLSSSNAKKYTVINTSIHLNEPKKTQEQAPNKKQSESGVAAELERLQKLLNSGAITKDEYQKAKNKVLK